MDFAVHGAIYIETMPLSSQLGMPLPYLCNPAFHAISVLYVCGDSFADVECDDDFVLNIIYNLSCNSSIEILYCSAGNTLFVLLKKI